MVVKWDGDAVFDRVARAAMIGVIDAANIIHAEGVRLIMESPRGGRMYGAHKASAPGEPPASDTGELVRSGQIILDYENISASVNWTSPKATFLEFGTERMEPRPFARPSVDNKRAEIDAAVATRIAEALKK